MKIELQPGEARLDTWSIIYQPPGGGKFNGKLIVTNKRLLYDAKFDLTVKGLLTEAMFVQWGSAGYLEIKKKDIEIVEVEKSFLSKKVILTLADASKHTFNYGMLSIDKLVDAINVNDNGIISFSERPHTLL